jgi:hypothetical protein
MESPLLDFKEDESKGVTLRFQVNGELKNCKTPSG